MIRCHIDVESYSDVNLKESGVYVYAEHESTELLVLCYRFDDGPTTAWIPLPSIPATLLRKLEAKIKEAETVTASTPIAKARVLARLPPSKLIVGAAVPDDLRAHIEAGKEVAAHNAQFERVVLNGVAGRKVNFPKLKIENMICTAAKARTYGLPGALGDAASALDTFPKDESARGIMLMLCRPRTGKMKRWSFAEAEDDYVHLYTYCIDDVKAEADLDKHVPDITPEEMEVWRLDQRINDRGVGVDLDAVADLQALIKQYKLYLQELCVQATGFNPTQREKVVGWVRTNGYPQITDMQAETVERSVADPKCPDPVKHVLKIYSTYGMKAVSKYDAIEAAVSRDSRIHGMFIFCGAGPGRWSSIIVQLQNLFRPKITDPDVAIQTARSRNLEDIRFLYPDIDPMKVFASCVRGTLVPAEDHDLLVLDYAGIESRVIAWLYDEIWKLEAFRAFDRDKKGKPDNYQLAYGNGFGVDPMKVNKFQRQIGKVMELALGFEGGVGAFLTMAPTYHVDLNDLVAAAYDNLPEWALDAANWMWKEFECKRGRPTGLPEKTYLTIDGIKQVWRGLHPAIKQGWKDTLQAAKLAVKYPGKCFATPNRKLMFMTKDVGALRWLHMRLPSGRTIKYFAPELHDGRAHAAIAEEAEEKKLCEIQGIKWVSNEQDPLKKFNLTFMGVNSRTRRWERESAYGGFLGQNGTQGTANCLLRKGSVRVDRAGYPIILTVHDEVGAEVQRDQGSLEEMSGLLCYLEPCFAGLPVTAEGYRTSGGYRKE